jgi:uncharacterized protein
MADPMTPDFARVAQDLQIRKVQVESVVQLLDEGNTVPFITRYRKERTGGLNEDIIRKVQARVAQMRQLAERKQTILKSIEGQGKLTDALRESIVGAESAKRLEDLYQPFKPKKRSLATAARDKGLEPLATAIWNKDPAVANLDEVVAGLVNPEKELPSPVEVLQGVQHILAEQVADTADVRAAVRAILWDTGKLVTNKVENLPEAQGRNFKDYFEFTEPIRQVPPHRILAINRGEKESALKVKLEWDTVLVQKVLFEGFDGRPPLVPLADHPHAALIRTAADDALSRLLLPSLEREVRRELTEHSQEHAVIVFARNLRSLLLQPPLRGKRVLAIDPGFRTGCKVAALDETGVPLADSVIYPHPPQNKKDEAKYKLVRLIEQYHLNVIAIGNGTACRETEEIVSDLIGNYAAIRTAAATAPVKPPKGEAPKAEAPKPEVAPNEPTPTPTAEAPATPTEAPPAPTAEAPPAEAPPAEAQPTETPPPAPEATAPPVEAPPPAIESPAVELPPLAVDGPVPELAYVIVNEAGASVYSASPVGREEFPDLDATLRGTISIGRRLQDPLSELVKIDPQNIGVGLYQHDLNPKQLKESLETVVETCVNHVGVDLNTASVPLLRHVSGLNQLVARELVDYRKAHGPFTSREQLMQVPSIGPARYVQAAGFLKLPGGGDPLDVTWIHPESYPVARRLLTDLGYGPEALHDPQKAQELREKLKALSPEEVSARLEVGLPTLRDILDALERPGRDPREDLPPPIFKKGILKLEDLQPGMELKGTVLNVVDFGAFVDVGLKDSGLVHISQMANRYIKNPYDVVAVGDVVTVWVLKVDQAQRHVSLTMIKPGTERKPPERKPLPPRAPRVERPAPPPRVQQPAPPPGQPKPPQRVIKVIPPRRPSETPAEAPAANAPPANPPRVIPPRPPRKPPKAKLTQAALEGAAPLRSLGELAAYFEAKQVPPPKTEAPKAEAEPVAPEAPKDNNGDGAPPPV